MGAIARWLGIGRDKPEERAAFTLYTGAMKAAREPFLFTDLGVPDTLDGRFDMVGLYASLLIRRLRRDAPPGPALAQAVFDAMFSDMDVTLREMGVSDLSVGKKVRAMWEAFHGRARAYESALDVSDDSALAAALARNVWRGGEPPPGSAAALARLARAQDAHLAAQPVAALTSGTVHFLPAAEAVA
jgi:cytochrome b pre-mRNA-processing protein 3